MKYKVLYHMTSLEAAKKIKRVGYLQWRPSRKWGKGTRTVKGLVYLGHALPHVVDLGRRVFKKTPFVICVVKVPCPLSLWPDDNVVYEFLQSPSRYKLSEELAERTILAFEKAARNVLAKRKKTLKPSGIETLEEIADWRSFDPDVLSNKNRTLSLMAYKYNLEAHNKMGGGDLGTWEVALEISRLMPKELAARILSVQSSTFLASKAVVPVKEIYVPPSKETYNREFGYHLLKDYHSLTLLWKPL